jgi:hypothetical protein
MAQAWARRLARFLLGDDVRQRIPQVDEAAV